MLNICCEISHSVSLQFNVKKCHCMAVGRMYKAVKSPLILDGQAVEWCDRVKYLGIYLGSAKAVKFDINPVKRSFYAACNLIFSHSHGVVESALLTCRNLTVFQL